jgi:mRNA-degrading endonuclease RelE of RelBE toxin-antitoxin system
LSFAGRLRKTWAGCIPSFSDACSAPPNVSPPIPGRLGRKLHGSDNAFRIRVGDYRIGYTVDDAVLIVAIERIRHRGEVYR